MPTTLTPAQQHIVDEELQSGRFQTPEEVITRALEALRERTVEEQYDADARHRAVQDMLAFAEENRTRLDGLSVKELIHEGHHPQPDQLRRRTP